MNKKLSPLEHMRATVQEQELSARSWKAYYEKMYYSIEAEKLEKPYAELQEKLKERLEKQKNEIKDLMADLPLKQEIENE